MIRHAAIVGGSGQVARAIQQSLKQRRSVIVVSSSSGRPGSVPLDLAKPENIRYFFMHLERQFPGGGVEVFLPGALTHVDRCESERDLCRKINVDGPALVAEECQKRKFGLTYFSTEYVFGGAEYEGGEVGPFSEEAKPYPTCWYGETKLEAERAILSIVPKALVLRTTMVFSWDPKGMNFLMQYVRHLERMRNGENPPVFKIPEDQISTPTFAPALAESACLLREQGESGIFNLVGSDLLSRRDLVMKVIDAFGCDRESSLKGFQFLKTKDLGQPAKRPLTAGLTADKARAHGIKIYSLEEAFREARAAADAIKA
jgi:dTDP-4-dehydrorhamnose reductase